MRVYRWKKPNLTLELVAGGSLSASTKYYIYAPAYTKAYSGNGDWYVNSAPVSDVYDITTDETNKSIKVSLWFSGNVTTIASGSTGKLLITSPIHCLGVGDDVTISGTSSYDGTYSVTDWVDYNSFMVTGAYSNSGETGIWTSSGLTNGLQWWHMYCSAIDPRNADGTYKNTAEVLNKFTHGNALGTSASDYTITSQPSSTRYGPGSTWECKPRKQYSFYLDIGYPCLYGTDASKTVAEIQAELDNAGLGNYNLFPMYVTCNIQMTSLVRTFTHYPITFIATAWKMNSATFNECSIVSFCPFSGYTYSGSDSEGFYGTLKNSSYLTEFAYNNFTFSGVNRIFTPFYGNINRANAITSAEAYGWEHIGSSSEVIKDMTYISEYPFLSYHGNSYTGYSYQNLDLKYTHLGSYDITLSNQGSSLTTYKILNVDTQRENNKKIIRIQLSEYSWANFECWRQKTVTVTDKNNIPITGASITMFATSGTTGTTGTTIYNYTTDSSGQFTFTILEQYSAAIASSVATTAYVFTNWDIEIRKEGYQTYKAIIPVAKNIPTSIELMQHQVTKLFDGAILYSGSQIY